MKNLLIITILFIAQFVTAQNDITKAFSESYTSETNKEYQKAITSLTPFDNNTYEVNLRLGWLYYLKGEFNKSKIYYNKAIANHKNSLEARFGLVYPIAAMKNWDEVMSIYNDILKIDKNNTKALYRLAYINFTRKNWDTSENQLQKILELYPFDYDANLLLGSVLIKNGKIAEAKKVLQKALIYNPQSKTVLELLKGL